MIWFLAAVVALVAVLGFALPWWWSAFAQRAGLRRRSANVAAYRGRLEELSADEAGGILAPDAVESAKAELAARLLQDADAPEPAPLEAKSGRGLLVGLALVLVAFSVTWYVLAGSWRTQALVELAQANPELARSQAVDAMIARLRERLADNPEDADSWIWLARTLGNRGNWADAAQAFARASALKGAQDPGLLVEEGEALAYAQDRSMAGEPAARFAQALALAPDHPQALWYSGIAALQAGDAHAAVEHWERLSRQPLPDEIRQQLDHSLAQLRERAGIKAPSAPAQAKAPAAQGLQLQVAISVAPELAGDVDAASALFVFAQDPSGPPMPLAVQRRSAAELPARVILDDTMSPMPTRKLSSIDRWRIVARISRSGSANPQPGDLEGSVEVDKSQAGKPVQVVISRRRA